MKRIFVEKLTAALRDCAAGRGVLFGHNDHLLYQKCCTGILALGEDIRGLRGELGFSEPFAL